MINMSKKYHISQRNRVAIIETRLTPNYTVTKMLNELLSLVYFGVIDSAIRGDKSQSFFVLG